MTNVFPQEALANFVLQAKRHSYASQGDEATVAPLLSGSKQLEYRDGLFFYRDIYVGMAYFVGQEIVAYQDHPVWSMSYAGGVSPAVQDRAVLRAIYAFLRLALRQGTVAHPYRGPAVVREGAYMYTNQSEGTLEAFWGHERITDHALPVYALHYSGGALR
ncbi:MAG: hypothetical protein HY895_04845 [Deltaproteobacteria bacterium]|nr:hypothetical protein [Deltaproteobacteria bacterium]